MRIDRLLLPASFAVAATFAVPGFAQNYDTRDYGPDRYYDRHEERMRDRSDDRRWNRSDQRWDESRRDMDRYRDNRRSSAPYTSRDYGDNRGYGAGRDYYDDRYVRDSREYWDDPDDRYGRGGGPYSQQWLYEDRYAAENRFQRDRSDRYGRGGGPYSQQWLYEDRYSSSDDGRWRDGRRSDYTAERDRGVDFDDMDVRDRAQWNEQTYRGSANRGLHE